MSVMTPDLVLILQRGSARLNVYDLDPQRRFRIGRSPDNEVTVPDPKCSRHHCELYHHAGEWILRDLDSKNGLTVDGSRIRGDWPMEPGQSIQIGECRLQFTRRPTEDESVTATVDGAGYVIVERKTGTQFDSAPTAAGRTLTPQPFIELIQLGRGLNDAADIQVLAQRALAGLLRVTSADRGLLLLTPSDSIPVTEETLEAVAVLGREDDPSDAYSRHLTRQVIAELEALLVHDVGADGLLSQSQSLKDMAVTSAICAPVRHEGRLLGILHLYASNPATPVGSDDLEFALAVADQVGTLLPTLRRHEAVVHRLEQAKSELQDLLEIDTELVGESESLQKLKRSVGRVARTDATVLIRGESGVGKELVARAVHLNSSRRDGPFVCVNCAALTESLLESELFGHEKGAFTGASNQKPGKFEQAHEGTLFLDEVGEMSPEIQAKFLRVLEGQPFERVGGGKAIAVDVRVVTATNRELEDAVRQGAFRQDLFYRLQVIEILVPPLRKHPEDIPALAQHFLERFARKSATKVRGFNRAAMDVLMQHRWPGNVRELRNVVERAVILADHPVLTPDDIQLCKLQPSDFGKSSADMPALLPGHGGIPGLDTALTADGLWRTYIDRDLSLDDIERMYMEAVLERFNWNKSQASRLLGIERTTLDRRLKKFGLNRP
jgi:transcriptional regulator with GAF, ATPase, and Fis domain